MVPKQYYLNHGPGSLIRLPFGVHRKSGKRYGFMITNGLELAGEPEDQILLLNHAKAVSDSAFDEFWQIGYFAENQTNENKFEGEAKKEEMALSDKIKARVTAIDFISQYVKLSSTGRGLCPFHDDRNASFSVNIEKNYWKCFAGCGGGSIIDFWMVKRNCDFKQAIHELGVFLF